MLDVVLPASAPSRPTGTLDRAHARAAEVTTSTTTTTTMSTSCTPAPSPKLIEVQHDMSVRSAGNFMPVFTVSSFDSGLPLTLPDSSVSGGPTLTRHRHTSVTINDAQRSSTTNRNSSLGGSASTSAVRRHPYGTPPPLFGHVAAAAAASTVADQQPNAAEAPQDGADVQPLPMSSTTSSTRVAVPSRLPSMPNAAPSREAGPMPSLSPNSPLVLVDTASVPHPFTGFAATATATAAPGDATQRRSAKGLSCSASPTPPAATTDSTWVDYDSYLSLSAPLLPLRALQDRVAELCCSSSTAAGGRDTPLRCLDEVIPFLLHGRGASLPVRSSPLPTDASSSPRYGGSHAAERVCFPVFCLAGAKLCSLSEHNESIRSIHTPTPPLRAAMAIRPQAEAPARAKDNVSASPPRVGRLRVLLLFAEQLLEAFPDFPADLLLTTSPSGAVVPAQTTEHRSWLTTPHDVRRETIYDAVWGVITLRRFAVLLQRWGLSPAEAVLRLRSVAKAGGAVAVPRQRALLATSTTESTSHLSVPTPPQEPLVANANLDAGASMVPRVRPHLPYPPSASLQLRQTQHQLQGSGRSSASTDTIVSGSSWDYPAHRLTAVHTSSGAAFNVPAAAAGNVRTSPGMRSWRVLHDPVFTTSSVGMPLVVDGAERVEAVHQQEDLNGEASHPYNASAAADPAALSATSVPTPVKGWKHRYDVPSPPSMSPPAPLSERGVSFLRTFSRSGGAMPTAAVPVGSPAFEAWGLASSKSKVSGAATGSTTPTYLPSPPKAQSGPRHQQILNSSSRGDRSRLHPTCAPPSTESGSHHSQDVFSPLRSRSVAAEGQRRMGGLRGTTHPPAAAHPYNIAQAAAAAAMKRHKKSHRRHRGSSHTHKNTVNTPETNQPTKIREERAAQGEVVDTAVQANGALPSELATKKSGSGVWSAERRTEEVNVYVQKLLTASAAATRKRTAANGCAESDAPHGNLSNSISSSSAVNGGAAAPAKGDPHASSDRSNGSANAVNVNRGCVAQDVVADRVEFAKAALATMLAGSAAMSNSAGQRVDTGMQHVPAPPPPSLSHRSNPHTSILQSWESSMLSPSDSGWRAAVESAGPAPRPSSWSPAPSEDDAPQHSAGFAVPTTIADSSVVIPSVASSQSQLSPLRAEKAAVLADNALTNGGGHSGSVASGASVVPQPHPPAAAAFAAGALDPTAPHVLNGVATKDTGVWLVSHTPDHGFVVTSLPQPSATAYPATHGASTVLVPEVVREASCMAHQTPSVPTVSAVDVRTSSVLQKPEEVPSTQVVVAAPAGERQESPAVDHEGGAAAAAATASLSSPTRGAAAGKASVLSSDGEAPLPLHVAHVEAVRVPAPTLAAPTPHVQELVPSRVNVSVPEAVAPLNTPIEYKSGSSPSLTEQYTTDSQKTNAYSAISPPAPRYTETEMPPRQAPPLPLLRPGFAAQLRALVAPVMQAVGRGYIARRGLGHIAAARSRQQRVGAATEPGTAARKVASRPLSISIPVTAKVVAAESGEASLNTPTLLQPSSSGGGYVSGVTVPAAATPGARTQHEIRPPPLTAFAVPDVPMGLPSPVLDSGLPLPHSAPDNAAARTVNPHELSGFSAGQSGSLLEPPSAHELKLTHSTSFQHPSSVSPTQRLFAVYGVPSNCVMENCSSSWMPPVPVPVPVLGVGHATASFHEGAAVDSRHPHRTSTVAGASGSLVVEFSFDNSRVSSFTVPWGRDSGVGERGMRDGTMSTHTLPPPMEEGSGTAAPSSRDRSLRDEGEEVETMGSSALAHIRRKENAHCTTSFIVPKTEGGAEAAVPPALMKPIMIIERDRPAEEATSALLRESMEGRLDFLHTRLNGADSCAVALLSKTDQVPAVTGSTSSTVAPQTRGAGDSGRRHSGSMDSTCAINSAMCMLRLQRIGRGYLTRLQLAQRCREAAEEKDLDAKLQGVLWQAAPVLPSATGLAAAAATASPTEERTAAVAGSPDLPAAKGTSSPTASAPRSPAGTAASTPAGAPARSSSFSSAAQIGRVLSPFLLPEEGKMPSTQSSGSVYGGDGAASESSPRHPSATITGSRSASRFTAEAPTAAASEGNSRRAREHSPFVTPENSRYLASPAFLPPSAYNGGQQAPFSQDYAPSNSLSLSREAAGTPSGVLAMPGPVFGSGSEAGNAASGGGGVAEPSLLPVSTPRRRGQVSPPSLRFSFSRDAHFPLGRDKEADAGTSGSALALFPASAAAATDLGGNGNSSSATRIKLVEGVNGAFLIRRGGSLPLSCTDASGVMATAATVTAARTMLPPAATSVTADGVAEVRSKLGGTVEEEEEVVGTPAGAIPCCKATSAAAGASNSPLEGSIFAVSSRSGRSMNSASSLPFEFSTTAHSVGAMSNRELMFSGRTVGNITPVQWALDGVAFVDSSSHFDDGESGSEDNNSGDSDEEGEEVQNSSDEDADEADAFRKDITHVEGLEPACFGAAAHLLRGEGAALTKSGALALLQRVGRGYLCRRHEHFLFMVSISFAEVALLQRVAVAFRTRQALGLEFHVDRLVREEMTRWDLRNRAAIKLHAVVRGFMARQRVKRLQRKLFTRLELRTALESPDPDE